MNSGETMKSSRAEELMKENCAATYTKKDCISRCRNLAPEDAYMVLAHFYGSGFAGWFVGKMVSNES